MKNLFLILALLSLIGCSNTKNPNIATQSVSKSAEKIYRFQINFDSNQAVIKSQYLGQIKDFASYLNRHPSLRIEIQGYTDTDGDTDANMLLSQKRANAVRAKLIAYHVAADRIKAIGFGEKYPIVKNDTEEHKFQNRRVEAHIISGTTDLNKKLKPGTLKGIAYDTQSDTALAGVTLNIYANNKLVDFTVTDSAGRYYLELEAGHYLVKYIRADYIIVSMPVTIKYGETTTLVPVALKPAKVQMSAKEVAQKAPLYRVTKSAYKLPGYSRNTGNNICVSKFGKGYRIADWIDIKNTYNKLNPSQRNSFYSQIGFTSGKSLAVSRRYNELYSSRRHYYMSKHDHHKPGHYLAHDNINRYEISLGSWWGNFQVLCIKK